MKRIGIVGAGISGLAAAWYIRRMQPDAQLELFEASDRVGGVIQTITEPHLIECGADNFATLIPDALQLVREMGLESEFITPQKNFRIAQVVCRGRLVPIPNGFSLMQPTRMGSILATPILSLRGRIRVLAEMFVPRRRDDSDESVASFAIRRLGRECFERLVEPIVGGIFTARAETLSMQAAMPQFVAMEKEHGSLIRAAFAKRRKDTAESKSAREASGARYDQFMAPRRGMSWWFEQLAAPVLSSIHLGTRVQSIRRTAEGAWELLSVSDGEPQTRRSLVDQVCLAIPAYRAAELLKEESPELAQLLGSIPYASSAIAVLGIQKKEIWPHAFCFGSIAPSIEKRNCLAVSLSSEKYAGRCPEDTVLARVFMGGAVRPELVEQSDERLLEMAKREVEQLFGATSPPSFEKLVRWPQAMPQYLVGHHQKVERIRSFASHLPGLELVGNAYDGVGIPQCVRGAKAAAARISDRISGRTSSRVDHDPR
jgi:protoporphyrinogen/coproporphyrinogen III oxidase